MIFPISLIAISGVSKVSFPALGLAETAPFVRLISFNKPTGWSLALPSP